MIRPAQYLIEEAAPEVQHCIEELEKRLATLANTCALMEDELKEKTHSLFKLEQRNTLLENNLAGYLARGVVPEGEKV